MADKYEIAIIDENKNEHYHFASYLVDHYSIHVAKYISIGSLIPDLESQIDHICKVKEHCFQDSDDDEKENNELIEATSDLVIILLMKKKRFVDENDPEFKKLLEQIFKEVKKYINNYRKRHD